MPTPNEITTIIASKFGKELDIPYRLMLYEKLKAWRARLIANALDRNPADAGLYSQSLIIEIEASEDGGSISKTEIPDGLEHGAIPMSYVGSVDGKQNFIYAPAGSRRFLKSGCYASLIPSYEKVGKKIWVDTDGMEEILVSGVFEDTDAAYNCCGKDGWDEPFPAPYKLLQQIIEYLTQFEATSNMKPPNETQQSDVEVPSRER